MSYQATAWVLSHSLSVGSTRLVALAIAQRVNEKSLAAWPSIETLAREAKVCRKSVFLAIRKLSSLGELNKISGGGRHKTNRYTLPLVSPQKAITFPEPWVASIAEKRCNPFPETVYGLHPNNKEPSKSNTKAAQPLRVPPKTYRTEQEQRRIVNASDSRIRREDEYRREVLIGLGPQCVHVRPEYLARIQERVAARGL